jgi:putative tryptophan/tyrosine transport system substrate-binding protein
MRRREFIALMGGATTCWAVSVHAQQAEKRSLGYLSARSSREAPKMLQAFLGGLRERGFEDGTNIDIQYRWADGDYERLPSLAADLVQRRVALIAAVGGTPAPFAARAATAEIPIVFLIGDDPVKHGLVASLSRPNGNATGVNIFVSEIEGKRVGLMRELVGERRAIGALLNPKYPVYEIQRNEIEAAARAVGQQIRFLTATDEEGLRAAFAGLRTADAGGLLIVSAPFFNARRELIVALAADYQIPTIYALREYPEGGGLISYGTDLAEAYRQVGTYCGRVLKGESPAELPVVQSTKFELVLNLRTAKALNLTIPPTLLARADEVIE